MSRPLVVLLALTGAALRSAQAQADASVSVGLGTVRYPGGASLGVVSVGPTFQRATPGQALNLGGVVSALARGEWYGQARASQWIATSPIAGRWRVAADVGLSGTTGSAGNPASGSGLLIAEVLWIGRGWGAALGGGPTSGWISGTPPVNAAHARLRGWWQDLSGGILISGVVEPTRLLGAWFTDVGVGLVARRGPFEGRVWASVRVSDAYGSKAAALGSGELRLTRVVSLEASGGNVLPDPYQGFPGSAFVSAGVRLRLATRTSAGVLAGSGPFTMDRHRNGLVIRLRQRGLTTVAIAGDWDGWTATPLVQVRRDVWEIVLRMVPGTYRFMLLLDGRVWTIPPGVPSVPDGMGNRVAVLNLVDG